MLKELRCPKCGSDDVLCDDVLDTDGEFIDGLDGLVEECVGHCEHCGAELRWEFLYRFYGVDNMTVESDGESEQAQLAHFWEDCFNDEAK